MTLGCCWNQTKQISNRYMDYRQVFYWNVLKWNSLFSASKNFLVFWKWDNNEKFASKSTVSLFIWTQINYQLKLNFVSSKQSNRGAVSRTHWALKSLMEGSAGSPAHPNSLSLFNSKNICPNRFLVTSVLMMC